MALKDSAENYVRDLVTMNLSNKTSIAYPLDRLEAHTVMVSFISEIVGEGKRIHSNYYLPEKDYGDNSDNGHYIIDINEIENYLLKARKNWQDS